MNSSAAEMNEIISDNATPRDMHRKPGKRIVTPLGFTSGSPCPRVCGGILEETEGAIRCNRCDFRYPASESAKPPLRLVVQDLAPIVSERRVDALEDELDAKALAAERDALLGVVRQLKEENRRLLTMVYQMMSEKPATKNVLTPVFDEKVVEETPDKTREAIPAKPDVRRSWWSRGFGAKRR